MSCSASHGESERAARPGCLRLAGLVDPGGVAACGLGFYLDHQLHVSNMLSTLKSLGLTAFEMSRILVF